MHLDIGTGDGRYLLQRARNEPGTLFTGLEPNHASLVESSRTAGRSNASLENLAFILGSLSDLPGPLEGRADAVSILFPWGSLLRAVLLPEAKALSRLRAVCRPGATIEVVTALDAAADARQLARLGIESFSFEATAAAWRQADFKVKLETLPPDHAYETTWWRKIRQRETRQATRLTARWE